MGERMRISACYGYFDATCGACVGFREGSVNDQMPCAYMRECRAFNLYLQARGHDASAYFEPWVNEAGVQLIKPKMGFGAFKRFCTELVFEYEVSKERFPPAPGAPPVEEEPAAPRKVKPLSKIKRRGSYPSRAARMAQIAKLLAHFLDHFFLKAHPRRRAEIGHAPQVGQVFLTDSMKTGRYLTLFVRQHRRDKALAVIRYHSLSRVLNIEVDVTMEELLERIPFEYRRRVKKMCAPGRRLKLMVKGCGFEEVAFMGEAVWRLIQEGVIEIPAWPE